MVAEINRRRSEDNQDLDEAVIQGALCKCDVLMMVVVALLVWFLPPAHWHWSDVQRPLATVLVGGLLSTLLLTLLALPSLYALVVGGNRSAHSQQQIGKGTVDSPVEMLNENKTLIQLPYRVVGGPKLRAPQRARERG